MKILRAADVTASKDYTYIELAVPEWGDDVGVRMRTLTSGERHRFETQMFQTEIAMVDDGKGNMVPQEKRIINPAINLKTLLLGMCLVDEDGARLYPDDGIGILDSRNAVVINRLFTEAMKLNGMNAEAVSDKAKNS
jgi:hypothetical protein